MVVHLKEGRHSPRGASGFSRWSVCGGSVALSEGLSSPGSSYAAEGTAAHWVVEQCLENNQDGWEFVGTEFKVDKTKPAEDGTAPEFWAITADVEMVDAVQVMLDTIRNDIDEYMAGPDPEYPNQQYGDPIIWVEQTLSLEALGQPDMFGKADCIVYFPAWSELRVYDYKHGAGVLVEVKDNGQLRYYAVGAVFATQAGIGADGSDGVDHVQSIIVQPRADHRDGPVRREKLSIDELNAWAEFELIPAADRTREVDAPLVTGPHCGWCVVKQNGKCPKHNATGVAMIEAAIDLDAARPIPDYSDYRLAGQLDQISIAEDYIKALKAEAFKRLEAGKMKGHGWGLVKKKANRQWKDGAEPNAWEEFGIKAYEPPKPKTIRSPAQLSKLAGGPEFAALWAFTPDTGLTLARTDGKRKMVEVEDRDAAMREALDKPA